VSLDFAHPSLSCGAIECRQCEFKAFDDPLVMILTERNAKSAGAESNVGKSENPIIGCVDSQIVRDALDVQVRESAVHDAEEIGYFFRAARLSLVPAEFCKLL
jgi:hypothetical protein